MLKIHLTALKCSYHINMEYIWSYVLCIVFASILWVALGIVFEANRNNVGVWCWWNIAQKRVGKGVLLTLVLRVYPIYIYLYFCYCVYASDTFYFRLVLFHVYVCNFMQMYFVRND